MIGALWRRLTGARADATPEVARCSFCGNDTSRARFIIAGPDVFICDDCVDVCNWVLLTKRDARFRHVARDAAGVFVVPFYHDVLVLTPLERSALAAMLAEVAARIEAKLLGWRQTHDSGHFDMLQATFDSRALAEGRVSVEALQASAQQAWHGYRTQAVAPTPEVAAAGVSLAEAAHTYAAALDTADVRSRARNDNPIDGLAGPPAT